MSGRRGEGQEAAVIFWIHGGGFRDGSSRECYFDGKNWPSMASWLYP